MNKAIAIIKKRIKSNKQNLKRLENRYEEDDYYEDMQAIESTKYVIQELESLLEEVINVNNSA